MEQGDLRWSWGDEGVLSSGHVDGTFREREQMPKDEQERERGGIEEVGSGSVLPLPGLISIPLGLPHLEALPSYFSILYQHTLL